MVVQINMVHVVIVAQYLTEVTGALSGNTIVLFLERDGGQCKQRIRNINARGRKPVPPQEYRRTLYH